MTLTPAETARKVADVIDYENERFDMGVFQEERDCGTVGCIAGHTALLHGDTRLVWDNTSGGWGDDSNGEWLFRQGFRLGLTHIAACRLFYPANHTGWPGEYLSVDDRRYSLVLRQLEKELADRAAGDLIDREELDQIIMEALG